LENSFIPLWAGWALLGVVVAGYAAIKINDAAGRRRAGLPPAPTAVIAVKVLTLAALGALFTHVMDINRNLTTNAFFSNKAQGMPWVVLLLVILFAGGHFVLSRTGYGRHLYAVGGNEEASRRAGIVVSRIRISVFVICSGMAAVSGIAAASLLQSVQSNAGAGNTLLLAVGAAVIGGTSLFGGHGRMIDAVLGGLVVAVIINGMSDLIQGANSAGYEYVVTGAVSWQLLAAGFDAASLSEPARAAWRIVAADDWSRLQPTACIRSRVGRRDVGYVRGVACVGRVRGSLRIMSDMDIDQSNVSIRPGDEHDVPAVVALMDGAVAWLVAEGRADQWGTDPYSTEPRRVAAISSMAAGRELHVAVSGDNVVGALAVGSALSYVPPVAEPELYIRLLVTDRACAGRGIGGRLLEHARTIARAGGVELLRVDCYAGPDRALIRYYEEQGFTATDGFEVARPSGPWPGQVLQQRLS
jgi:predicted ABC-type sugar transport system permease subunit/GNAT superfamily N-acetyltransferase